MNENIKSYLEQLLVDAGQTGLPKPVKEQFLEDLNQRLEQRLMILAVDNLPEDKQLELEKMAKAKTSAADVDSFLRGNIKDYENLFRQAFADFRKLYLEE